LRTAKNKTRSKIALQNHSKAVTDENPEFTIRKPFRRADGGEPTLTFTIGNAAGIRITNHQGESFI
jgi:hypothetical protein